MRPLSLHRSVLLEESIAALRVQPGGTYVDATFGSGGHSRRLLAALNALGRLVALDRDPEAVALAKTISDSRFTIVHTAFSALPDVLRTLGIERVDGILFDLGVSSPQLDTADRGFSFRFDAVLDMRMDTSQGATAADWLAAADESEIRKVVSTYGEERFAKQIASAIVAERCKAPITTTRQLAAIVASVIRRREPGQDPATRTFQAIRIHLNRELEELSLTLPRAIDQLCAAGRIVVISFHSLEDRVVKRIFRAAAAPDLLPRRLPVRNHQLEPPRLRLVGKPMRPSIEEIEQNGRARSATLRVGERLAERAII